MAWFSIAKGQETFLQVVTEIRSQLRRDVQLFRIKVKYWFVVELFLIQAQIDLFFTARLVATQTETSVVVPN